MILLLYKAFVYGEREAKYRCKIHPRGSHSVLIRSNNANKWRHLWLSQQSKLKAKETYTSLHVSPHAAEKMVCLNIHSMFLPKQQRLHNAVLLP